MKRNIHLAVFLLLILANVSMADSNKEQCQSELKICLKEKIKVSSDFKSASWDMHRDAYKPESIPKIIDGYFEYFSCQPRYKACLNNREFNLAKYYETLANLKDAHWETINAKQVGMDGGVIEKVAQRAGNVGELRSLLVAKDGKLVVEEYYQLKDDPRPTWIASVTKSIVSLLIGVAIDKNFISSEHETIGSYYKEYFAIHNSNGKDKISIQNLLQMRSGLEFTDAKYWYVNSPGNTYTDYWFADNAHTYALDTDLIYKPGEKYQYSTPAVNILTSVINEATSMSAGEFAKKYLFKPLGIEKVFFAHDSNEYYMGGHVLFMRPRGLARIGQMILDDGKFNGKQIVSKKWLEKSFQVHEKNVWPDVFVRSRVKLDYALLWYVSQLSGHTIHVAYGYGGNFIVLVPEKNMLIVTTASNDVSLGSATYTPDNIFLQIIKPILNSL